MSREGSPEPRTSVQHAPTTAFVREFGTEEAQTQAANFTVPTWAHKVRPQSAALPRVEQRSAIAQEDLLVLCAMGAAVGLLFWLVFLR